jgi:hypothetical protein
VRAGLHTARSLRTRVTVRLAIATSIYPVIWNLTRRGAWGPVSPLERNLLEVTKMAASDGYGQRLGERLRVEKAPAIVTKTLRKAEIAFTEIRCDDPLPGMTSKVQREDPTWWG